jgi:hypothetical protein
MIRSRLAAWLIGVVVVAGAGASACATTHAKNTSDAPPLDMPPPPARTTEATDTEPPAPVPLPEEPARRTPPAARRQPTPSPSPRPDAIKPDAAKPDTPPAVIEAPKPSEEPPKPPPTLQTAPAGRENEEEQRIRTQLTHATNDLNRIDYRALNTDARTQYNTAKRFVTQAEDALKAKNLVFAHSMADKAAALAAQLAGK